MEEGKEHGELAEMDAHHCCADPGAHVSSSEFRVHGVETGARGVCS